MLYTVVFPACLQLRTVRRAAAGRGAGPCPVVSVASCVLDNDGRCNRDKVTVENAVNHCCAGGRSYVASDGRD